MNELKVTVLSPEESLEYWNQVKKENKALTREQIQHWAMNLPKGMQGNTDYLSSNQWDEFYEWILTDEGYQQWQEDLDILEYIKNYSFKKNK